MFSKKFKTIVYIEGMSCSHCVKRVEDALKEIDGVSKVKVDLKEKSAMIISSKEISKNMIKDKIEEVDYSITDIKVV